TMSGSTTQRFVVSVPPVGRVRFYGRTEDGREVASNPVSLRPRQQLEWDVFTNVVTERFGDDVDALIPSGATAPGRCARPAAGAASLRAARRKRARPRRLRTSADRSGSCRTAGSS